MSNTTLRINYIRAYAHYYECMSIYGLENGHIHATTHRIDLVPRARRYKFAPYLAEPKAREFEEFKIKRQLAATVTEHSRLNGPHLYSSYAKRTVESASAWITANAIRWPSSTRTHFAHWEIHRLTRWSLHFHNARRVQWLLWNQHCCKRPAQDVLRLPFRNVSMHPYAVRVYKWTRIVPTRVRHNLTEIQLEYISRLYGLHHNLFKKRGRTHPSYGWHYHLTRWSQHSA